MNELEVTDKRVNRFTAKVEKHFDCSIKWSCNLWFKFFVC